MTLAVLVVAPARHRLSAVTAPSGTLNLGARKRAP